MKPKDVRYPYSFDERRPHLEDRLLFVPEHYQSHRDFEMPLLSQIFSNDNPVALEFCSGNGQWILDRAEGDREKNWIAVEKQFKRSRKITAKMHNRQLDNVMVVSGEGLTFASNYLPDSVVDEIYVNFPDPWPKDRHAKHRIVQLPFANECRRILKPNGTILLVTDHPTYAEQMIDVMREAEGIEFVYEAPHFITNCTDYGPSFFDSLWRSKGRTIHFIKSKKV